MLINNTLEIPATMPGVAHKHIAVSELARDLEVGVAAPELVHDVADDGCLVLLGEALHDTGEPDSAHRPVIW